MPTTITASAVVSAFGDYYLNNGQTENDINTKLMEPFGTMDVFRVIESEDTILRETNTAFSEVLQGFQKAFTPKGGVTFTPKEIKLYNVKVDELFYPDDLKNSWLGFLTSNNLDRTTWPFVRWFIEEYVLKQIKEDLELQAIFGGVYSAPTAGTANAASAVMNGIKKIINDAITATTITVISTGAPSTTPETWCEQVEAFVASVPELYWHQNMTLAMSRSLALRYRRGRQKKYNMYYNQSSELETVEGFDNIKIKGLASHNATTKIWMTPAVNAVLGMKGGSNKDIVEVEKVDRQVKVYTDFYIGIGFINDSIVFTNDRELPS